MKYKLSAKETVGVLAVGLAASEVARRVADSEKSQKYRNISILASGTALYFAGVYIGTNRPKSGWLTSGGSSNKSGSCGGCGSHNINNQMECFDCGATSCKDCGCTEFVGSLCVNCGCQN